MIGSVKKYEMDENDILTNQPVDVLEVILKRLPLKDYLVLRTICHYCRKTISNVIENKQCCHLPEQPQVFLQSNNSRFFFSLSTKSVHHLGTPPLLRTNRCVGSVEGWLIVNDYSEKGFAKFFFLNPVTKVRILIPSKLSLPSNSNVGSNGITCVRKVVASSKPNCDKSDCYLVGLLSDFCHIAIYKLFDKSWNIVESDKDSGSYFKDVEIIGTKLYVNDSCSNSLLVCDLKDATNGLPKAEVLVKIPEIRLSDSSIISTHAYCFLAKNEALRELYIIYLSIFAKPEYDTQHAAADRLRIITSYADPPKITGFKVLKLDTSKDPIEWQNVKLEDRVAFVSGWNTMVMSRDQLSCNEELTRGNRIYFAVHFRCPTDPWPGLQLGMFDLTDSSFNYFPVETSKDDDVPYPLWIVPSVW
ncbi:uncharacterized protein LOC123892462 [Trifolium pratense]|uniref:Uncharacterized protein n=2 Tax=Trifolium pratense TaxID=57577 RepID=A0ACB0LN60_TRIPR|nr:uncharacterized protein LOC123892462 [Trifolium pratense]CAJ2670828.1 unnamed protein product [Trifolium pratense]